MRSWVLLRQERRDAQLLLLCLGARLLAAESCCMGSVAQFVSACQARQQERVTTMLAEAHLAVAQAADLLLAKRLQEQEHAFAMLAGCGHSCLTIERSGL